MSALSKKAFSGSERRRKRWLQNYKDSHDSESRYSGDRFGYFFEFRRPITDDSNAVLASEFLKNINDIAKKELDPFYKPEQLQFFRQFLDRSSYCDNARFPPNIRRKDLKKRYYSKDGQQLVEQIVFTPRLALYLVFMSEDNVLARYLRTWRRLRPHISLQIPENLISADLRPYCTCSSCFGQCVRIAEKYHILPPVTIHELLESERKKQ